MTDTIKEQDATTEAGTPAQPELTIEQRVKHIEDTITEHLIQAALDGIRGDLMARTVKTLRKKVEELESQPLPVFGEMLTSSSENTHIRIQTTKNTKGYGFETVVAVDGADATVVSAKVRELLAVANSMARDECARLETLDSQPDGYAGLRADSSGDAPDVAQ